MWWQTTKLKYFWKFKKHKYTTSLFFVEFKSSLSRILKQKVVFYGFQRTTLYSKAHYKHIINNLKSFIKVLLQLSSLELTGRQTMCTHTLQGWSIIAYIIHFFNVAFFNLRNHWRRLGGVVFDVHINGATARKILDIISWSSGQ